MNFDSPRIATTTRNVDVTPMLSDQAYLALRFDILTGAIEPGVKLKMEELQRRYQFSSSPLREALNRLAAEQIVTVDERRGFRAARISLADLRDLTTFRLILEVNAFESAMRQGAADWEAGVIAALHRLEALEQGLPAKSRSLDGNWIVLHKAYHVALIAACGSSRLMAACSAMFDQSQRYRSLLALRHTTPRASAPRNAGPEHRRLVEAALKRDIAAGRQLLGDHIQKTADQVSKFLG